MKKGLGKKTVLLTVAILFFAMQLCAQQAVRIKDVAKINGLEDIQLYGYGLVVGLAGTGDRSATVFTNQTVTNMLKNMGIEMPNEHLRVRNVAAVMVTGTLAPFKGKGTKFDVTVSSLGDATSLEGGTLILTPMQGPDGVMYSSAQGPLSTGGYDVRDRGITHIKKNHVLVGRIPDGAIVQKEFAFSLFSGRDLSISLLNPDFTSAVSMAKAINQEFGQMFTAPIAVPRDAASISLAYDIVARDSVKNYIGLIDFISRVENINFAIETAAKVVMNERTGTIVAGGNVRISEIAVTHGGIKVEIVNMPEVVQPQPFIQGQSSVIPNPQAVVEEKDADMIVLNNTATVSDLAQALNSLGVSPRDVISIFQAIKEAGALHGELVVM